MPGSSAAIHDPGDLVGEKTRVQRVVDGADAHGAVPGLQMPACIPGQRRDAVTQPETVALQLLRHPQRALPQLGIGGAHDRPFDRARDDLAMAVLAHRIVEDLVAQPAACGCINPTVVSLPFFG